MRSPKTKSAPVLSSAAQARARARLAEEDQALAGAGGGDVEQPRGLGARAQAGAGVELAGGQGAHPIAVFVDRQAEPDGTVIGDGGRVGALARGAARHENDRELQTLGLVHGHDAHDIVRLAGDRCRRLVAGAGQCRPQLGIGGQAQGAAERALALIDGALAQRPDDAVLLHYRGFLLYREGSYLVTTGREVARAKSRFEEAERVLARSAATLKWPETLALQSAVVGQLIALGGPLAGMRLGAKTSRLLGPCRRKSRLMKCLAALEAANKQ